MTDKVFPQDYLHFDTQDALKTITAMAEHIKEGYKLAEGIMPKTTFSKLLIAGMGGSGIAGDLLKYLLDMDPHCNILVETAKGYEPPKTVDKDTLLIAISYSGNTEETLSTYKASVRKGCQAILVSSGGKMQDLAQLNKHAHVKLPEKLQPRMALAYLFMPLLKIMENTGIIRSYFNDVKQVTDLLRKYQPIQQKAIALSEKVHNKVPIIYADSNFYPVAYRWKTQFNENAKTTAFTHAFSELNHNEILSFSNRPAPMHIIILSTEKYHRRILKRIELTKTLIQQKGVAVTQIAVKGSLLAQMFTAIFLGDLTSYYLALRYETDPTPVTIIEKLKKDLGPFLI